MSSLARIRDLIVLLPRRPLETWDRIGIFAEARAERHLRRDHGAAGGYPALWPDAAYRLAEHLGHSRSVVDAVLNEPALARIEETVRANRAEIRQRVTREERYEHDATTTLAQSCYVTCRLIHPRTVVETGVAYGKTSAFILQALAENGEGRLHSVDLPPLGPEADRFAGYLVPDDLRGRWTYHRGASRRILPGVLDSVGLVDLFVHDSLHTSHTMRWEFEKVWPRLREHAVLIADDIHFNNAFLSLQHHRPSLWLEVAEAKLERWRLGLAVKGLI